MNAQRRQKVILALSLLAGFSLTGLGLYHQETVSAYLPEIPAISWSPLASSSPSHSTSRLVAQSAFRSTVESGHAVVVLDENGFHDEVHGAVLWTLRQFEGLDIRFYRQPWRYAFEETIQTFWDTPPRPPKTFVADLEADTSIRHIILTTCDWDWYKVGSDLERIWEARAEDAKFTVTCFRHWNAGHVAKDLAKMAKWNSMSEVGLGNHVANALQANANWTQTWFAQWPNNEDTIEGLKGMPVRSFVPVFPAETYPEEGDKLFDHREEHDDSLNIATIQSTTWDAGHRNLSGIYADLSRHFEEDCESWGYLPPTEGDKHYRPIPDHPNRFQLYLIGGSAGWRPDEFKHVVEYRVGYSYPHFYAALKSSDIILPAFGKDAYDKDRASSTMGVTGSAPASLMTNQRYADAYGYFCPAFGIVRQDGESEIDHIAAIRKGTVKWQTRGQRAKALQECQRDWTSQNMLVMADLLRLR